MFSEKFSEQLSEQLSDSFQYSSQHFKPIENFKLTELSTYKLNSAYSSENILFRLFCLLSLFLYKCYVSCQVLT